MFNLVCHYKYDWNLQKYHRDTELTLHGAGLTPPPKIVLNSLAETTIPTARRGALSHWEKNLLGRGFEKLQLGLD